MNTHLMKNIYIQLKSFSAPKFFLTVYSVLFLSVAPTIADSLTPGKVQAGWVEKVTIENQTYSSKAKLDTGAKTSSIYAEDIEQFKENGKRWVKFTLVLEDNDHKTYRIPMKKERSRRVKVKEHGGNHDSRPVVELNICFDGRPYSTEFTLSDRKGYIYGILLGRSFLKGKALIDSELTFQTLASCHYKASK